MKILIGGDTVPKESNEKYFINGDAEKLFGETRFLAKQADRVIINLECALTDSDKPIKKFGPNLKGKPECVNALKKFGVTDVMLSNNHSFDFGTEGLIDTEKALSEAGLSYAGVGENDVDSRKPYIIEKNGERVGVINVCEHEYSYALPDRMGTNAFDPFITMQDIRELKKRVGYVIAIYHGGKEHCRYPSPRLLNLCREMVLCGADAVLCQHSHCIGCYEKYENGHILYGQGNFCFTKVNAPESWSSGLLVEIDTERKNDILFHPYTINEEGVELAKGKDREKIMSSFKERNETLKNGKWIDGWREFCKEMTYYDECVAESAKEQLFAHRIDCEAHLDVLKERFKTWNETNK